MAPQLDNKLMVRYLLGDVSEEEGRQLEEKYFDDDDYFESLEIVEGELIDAYVQEELSSEQSVLFERHFLSSPKRRRRLEFARSLKAAVPRGTPVPPRRARVSWSNLREFLGAPAMPIVLAAAVLVLAVGVSVSTIQSQRLRSQLAQMETQQAELRRSGNSQRAQIEQGQALNRQLSESLRAFFEGDVTPFTLSPGNTRAPGSAPLLPIGPGTFAVQFQLKLERDEYPHYSVVLETPEATEIWSKSGLQSTGAAGSAAVEFAIPAGKLKPGDFVLLLRGTTPQGKLEDVANYTFRRTQVR